MFEFKIAHTNMNVSDLDRSVKFYEEALGLKIDRRHDADGFTLVFLSDGEPDGHRIELTWLKDHTAPYDLGENEWHIAFTTKQHKEALEAHRAMGIVCQEPKFEGGFYFIEDPDGYWLEICPA